MRSRCVRVVFHPVFKQMLVSREDRSDVVCVEERHVALPEVYSLVLDVRPPMWTRRKWRLMTENDHAYITIPIQPFELAFYPLVLLLVACDVRIKGHNEGVPIRK